MYKKIYTYTNFVYDVYKLYIRSVQTMYMYVLKNRKNQKKHIICIHILIQVYILYIRMYTKFVHTYKKFVYVYVKKPRRKKRKKKPEKMNSKMKKIFCAYKMCKLDNT